MQWMDYNSQHFLPGPQFPVHPAHTVSEIDARLAESLNLAVTPPEVNQTREKEDGPLLPETPRASGELRPRGACWEL